MDHFSILHCKSEGPFNCKLCSFTTTSSLLYTRHKLLHNCFHCKFCGRTFQDKDQEYLHTSKKHRREIMSFNVSAKIKCNECSFETLYPVIMTQHINKHKE